MASADRQLARQPDRASAGRLRECPKADGFGSLIRPVRPENHKTANRKLTELTDNLYKLMGITMGITGKHLYHITFMAKCRFQVFSGPPPVWGVEFSFSVPGLGARPRKNALQDVRPKT